MNTLAGLQFQSRKLRREPTKAHNGQGASKAIGRAAIVTAMEPATRPSRPSMKLVKLITAVTAMTSRARTGRKRKLPNATETNR